MQTVPPSRAAPRLTVCLGAGAYAAALRELVAAGWAPSRVLDPATHERRTAGLLHAGRVDVDGDVEAVVALLAQGVSAAVECGDRRVAVDLYDQGSRLATAEWFDADSPPPTGGLDEVQLDLLCSIADGSDVEAAARRNHVSARTAARRLAAARATLAARSTAEAATRVVARIDALRPPG